MNYSIKLVQLFDNVKQTRNKPFSRVVNFTSQPAEGSRRDNVKIPAKENVR